MARMHSRKKGKSGSKRPDKSIVHSWVRYKPKEIELLIVKLAKQGKKPSQIGLHLRDTYGIPDVKIITKKKITDLLEKKNISPKIPEDLMFLLKRVVSLQKHIETNKKDRVAKRGLLLTESKIRRLVKYYKKSGKLPASWKYNPKQVTLLIE
ncbi:30S ribosomal protein S15 [Candidatus Woesearchaeota archaeon]|nr:30S ribosomal protein S15 [Candidatus Woesearchaeota archaeon]